MQDFVFLLKKPVAVLIFQYDDFLAMPLFDEIKKARSEIPNKKPCLTAPRHFSKALS